MIRWLRAAAVGAALAAGLSAGPGSDARAAEPRELRLDVFAFSQEDEGGQPFKAEGFSYFGARAAGRVEISPSFSVKGSAALALIDNDEPAVLPSTASSVTVTSARAGGRMAAKSPVLSM